MKRLYLILLGIFGFFIVSEIILRLFFNGPLQVLHFRPLMYAPDSVTNYRYIPGDYKKRGPQSIHVNKEGFIGDELKPKRDSVFRIAIVGASETSNSIDFSTYSAFPQELNTLFQKGGWNVEVINCGLDGARSYDTYRMIEYRVTDLNPDLILLSYSLPLATNYGVRETYGGCTMLYLAGDTFHKEISMDFVDDFFRERKTFLKIVNAMNHLYITRAVLKIYFKYLWNWSAETTTLEDLNLRAYEFLVTRRIWSWQIDGGLSFTEEESYQMIRDLKVRLNERGIAFFLFANNPSVEIKMTAKEQKLPLIMVKPEYEKGDYYYKDEHHNIKGNRKTAAKFYELLTKYNIVDSTYRNSHLK